MTPLSPTDRSTVRRGGARAQVDRDALHKLLADAVVCHLALVVDGTPRVVPTVFGFDPDGPDPDGTLYLHGSVAALSLLAAPAAEVSACVTRLDGLVLARSGFHHSMNYRSAVVVGRPRVVEDPDEVQRALDLVVDQVVPGRAATLRSPTRRELAATRVLALPLHEASVKVRTGGPVDDEVDVDPQVWAGVVPVTEVMGEPVAEDGVRVGAPPDVVALREGRSPAQVSMRSRSTS